MLPVCMVSETSVKVKIQHDQAIHSGVCLPGCSKGVSLFYSMISGVLMTTIFVFTELSTTYCRKGRNHRTKEYLSILERFKQESS